MFSRKHNNIVLALTFTLALLVSHWASAENWGDLEVALEPAEQYIDGGSAELVLDLPDVPLGWHLLSIDGEILVEDQALGQSFTLDTTGLADGEHVIVLEAEDVEGRFGGAATWITVVNPRVSVSRIEAPDVIWPASPVEIIVAVEGDAVDVTVDFSAVYPGFSMDEVELEPIGEGLFRLLWTVPDHLEGQEDWYEIPVVVVDSDGRSPSQCGFRTFLSSGPILPVNSETGILDLASIPMDEDPEGAAFVVDVMPEIMLVEGQESWLDLEVAGELLGAELLVGATDFGGYLVFPLVGEGEEGSQMSRRLSLPLRADWLAHELGGLELLVGIRDRFGRMGNVTTVFASALAQNTNALSVTMTWNAPVDLALKLIEPGGTEIYYSNPSSSNGGTLDLESDCSASGQRRERVRWPSAPAGVYNIHVGFLGGCSLPTPIAYEITIKGSGVDRVIKGNLGFSASTYWMQGGSFIIVPASVTVHGQVKYHFIHDMGHLEKAPAFGSLVQVLDGYGVVVGSGRVAGFGSYRVDFPRPASQSRTPYSLRIVTENKNATVIPLGGSSPYSYQHPTTWNPLNVSDQTLDVTVPFASSGPFHIQRHANRAHRWIEARQNYVVVGSPTPKLTRTTIEWSAGSAPAHCSTCFDSTNDRVYVSGLSSNPDEFDETVFLSEIAFRAASQLSRLDSSARNLRRTARVSPYVAWADGLATYLAQSMVGRARFIDRRTGGAVSFDIDNLNRITRGSYGGFENGVISSALIAGFLWDLEDGISSAENDQISGRRSLTMDVLWDLKTATVLDRGVYAKVDLADFVTRFGCQAGGSTQAQLNTLLDKRYGITWFANGSYCQQ